MQIILSLDFLFLVVFGSRGNIGKESYPSNLANSSIKSASIAISYLHEGEEISNFPDLIIEKVAISVKSVEKVIDNPISPCGSCRQTMFEYEQNQNQKIKIFLKGEIGKVLEMNSVEDLLPLAFKTDVLKRY